MSFICRVPDTSGIIIYGFVEPNTASNVINYRFVKKPLDNNEIKQAVTITITRYKIKIESRIAMMLISQPRALFSFRQ